MDWYSWYNISCLSIINKSKAKKQTITDSKSIKFIMRPAVDSKARWRSCRRWPRRNPPGHVVTPAGRDVRNSVATTQWAQSPCWQKHLQRQRRELSAASEFVRKPERLNLRGQAARGSSWAGLFARAYPRNAHASGVHAHCRGHYNFILCAAILDRILSNLIFRSWCG